MTSILKVDTIQDTAGNNIINESGDTITIGASGDTITIPSGATTTLTDGIAGDFKMNSGFGSIATAYGCRAWVNFNGTGTVAIRGNGNVSSITDNAAGDFTVNFTTAMSDTNYAVVAMNGAFIVGNAPIGFYECSATARTASLVRLFSSQSSNGVDGTFISVLVFR
jgi:hypothetical protein